ncbi:MAG: DUF1549 domain-containing protein, partial [Planctomycetota bacterium]
MTRLNRFWSVTVVVSGVVFGAPPAAAGVLSDEDLSFFESKVRPLLVERCYQCHATTSKKIKGGLTLDSRPGWATGGDSGPALNPGDLDGSLLIKAVRYTDHELKMPPKAKLSKEEIATLERWVTVGAPDPRIEAPATLKKRHEVDIEAGRAFWSFSPVQNPAPPSVKDIDWPRNDIDRFVLARLERAGLAPTGDTGKAALLRRATFDLLGLPPTEAQLESFLADRSPEAFERAVDRLLASPHFGERWGRHWLDVARFAESTGGGRSIMLPDAWRYRDYVIDSYNADKPFDRFVKEQLAGDLMPHRSGQERAAGMIATAFLMLGPHNYEQQDKAFLRMDIIDEQ